MATTERYSKGTQFFTNDVPAVPLAGGKLYYYQAGTTSPVATFSDSAGNVANTVDGGGAIVLDASGRIDEAVYLGSAQNYKELLTTAAGVTVSPWAEDNIPAANTVNVASNAAAPFANWNAVTSASSPITLTPEGVGKAYSADTTAGNVVFLLPAAASVIGGFCFKKNAAANIMRLTPNGAETIDGSAGNLDITVVNLAIGIFSDGSKWKIATKYGGVFTTELFSTSFINTLTAITALSASDEMLVQLAGAGAFRKILASNLFAVQADQETATSAVKAINPSVQQFHPSAAKFWVHVINGTATPTIAGSYNVTSITDTGVGILDTTIATDFSSANWNSSAVNSRAGSNLYRASCEIESGKTAGTLQMLCTNPGGTISDPGDWNISGFGDQ